MSNNCYIGRNATRYSSADLQAVLDEVVCCLENHPRTRRERSYHQPLPNSLNVGYWRGRGGGRGDYSPFCDHPGRSKSPLVRVRTPAVIHKGLSPIEQLATLDKFFLPPEALTDIAGAMAVRAGYRVAVEGQSWHKADVCAIRYILGGWAPLRELRVQVMKNVQDRREKRTRREHLRGLEETFRKGQKARIRQHLERESEGAIRAYHHAWNENEEQRQRLIEKGGNAEPAKTVVELCEELLAEAKQLMKEGGE